MLGKIMLKSMIRYFNSSTTLETVIGHKPPTIADNPAGRYAGSLFTSASKQSQIHIVLQDIEHLKEIIKTSIEFKQFLKNSAIKRNQQRIIFNSFIENCYSKITNNFLLTLIDSGRLADLQKIIETYINYCKILNKQQDIKIISSQQLTQQQCQLINQSIQKYKPNIKFKIHYQIDQNIMGGLQIYAGTEFLDCSLRSRMEKLKSQLYKIS